MAVKSVMDLCCSVYSNLTCSQDFYEELGNNWQWSTVHVDDWLKVIDYLYKIICKEASKHYTTLTMYGLENFLEKYLPYEMWSNEKFVLNLPSSMLSGEIQMEEVAGLLKDEDFVLTHLVPDTEKVGITIWYYIMNFHKDSPGEQLMKLAEKVPQMLRDLLENDCGIFYYEDFLKDEFLVPGILYFRKLRETTDLETYRVIVRESVGLHPTLLGISEEKARNIISSKQIPRDLREDDVLSEEYLKYCEEYLEYREECMH